MPHAIGLHHLHKRKRIHKKNGAYPHPDKFKRRYDVLMFVVAFLVPLMNIPQLVKIWYFKSAEGVSLISWIGFFIFSVLWLIYGILHKDKPIIIMHILLVLLQATIAVSILIYG